MKKFLIVVAALVLLIAALGIFAPRDFKLESEIVINRPINEVFQELKFLRNHEQWNAWSKKDPNMKKEFKGTDGTVGFTSSWVSENSEVGTAEQEIKVITPNRRIDTQIRMKKPFEGSFSSYITTESAGENKTKVALGMQDKMPFPMNVISLIVNVCFGQQKKILNNMDESLANLKSTLEK